MANVGDQFRGLDMKHLIGAPLTAAAEANLFLAKTTAEFINEVGFGTDNSVRNVQFKYEKTEPEPDGNRSLLEMKVDVPMLAIVPIPNLQIDEVNITFDMEVKSSEKSENKWGTEVTAGGGYKGFGASVNFSASVSASGSNTRSTDNSAKYHVSVYATNHGMPEGLSRVLDMMASSIAPNTNSSKPVDGAGNELRGSQKERNLKLRQLREERFQLESAEGAAKETFNIRLDELLRQANTLKNKINSRLQAEINKLQPDMDIAEEALKKAEEEFAAAKDEAAKEAAKTKVDAAKKDRDAQAEKINVPTSQVMDNNKYWDDFKAGIQQTLSLAASSDPVKPLSELRAEPIKDNKNTDESITNLNAQFGRVVEAHKSWEKAQGTVNQNRMEYNNAMMNIPASGTATALPVKA